MKYSGFMLNSQFLHLAFNNINEISGMLSCHLIVFLHPGQYERFVTTLSVLGNRYMQTFEKLPQMLPKIKTKKNITNYILNCEATFKIPSIQYWMNTTAS